MFENDTEKWAKLVFGNAELGDPRRTKRLVQLSSDLANGASSSIVKSCDTSAKIEAAYRFIRNKNIQPEDMADSGFQHTAQLVLQRPEVLAIQDTTGLTYKHSVTKELGEVSSSKTQNVKAKTLYAHSTLILDTQSEKVLGLANQKYYYREKKVTGTRGEQQLRPFEEKESFRWKASFEELKARLGDTSNVIDVCDREADIFEYLAYHIENGHRFIVRAKENRQLTMPDKKLLDLIRTTQETCCYQVDIKQRGGRKARLAKLALSYHNITLKEPRRVKGAGNLNLNVVICREIGDNLEDPLCWQLFTSESIESAVDALKVVRNYELRWRIEEFHKVWKSDGTEVEKLRMQTKQNLQRIAVIQAFIAIRLMQLREVVQNEEESKSINCEVCTTQFNWRILWLKIEKGKKVPNSPPSLHWFYYSLARLGGWYDSKRNGKVGIKALRDGWFKLMEAEEIIRSVELATESLNL